MSVSIPTRNLRHNQAKIVQGGFIYRAVTLQRYRQGVGDHRRMQGQWQQSYQPLTLIGKKAGKDERNLQGQTVLESRWPYREGTRRISTQLPSSHLLPGPP